MDGFLILDKPTGITSAHAVAKVKRLLLSIPSPRPSPGGRGRLRIGHGGTLDPLASGILPMGIGKATKLLSKIVDGKKTYRFTITWGESRDTDDAEGKVTATTVHIPTPEEIEAALPHFVGEIMQTPPVYSAIKLNGHRAYDLARAGKEVTLEARRVEVFELEVLGSGDWVLVDDTRTEHPAPSTTFLMTCGKGTYVRSIARDLASKLNSLGYISVLRRTAVHPFGETDAISLEKLAELVHKGAPIPLVSGESLLDGIPADSM